MEPGSFPIPVHPTTGRGASNPASERDPVNRPAGRDSKSDHDFGQVWDRAVGGKLPGEHSPAPARSPAGKDTPSAGPTGPAKPLDPGGQASPPEPIDPSDEAGMAQGMPIPVAEAQPPPVPFMPVQTSGVQVSADSVPAAPSESPSAPVQPLAAEKVVLTPIFPRSTGERPPSEAPPAPEGPKTTPGQPEAAPPGTALMGQTRAGAPPKASIPTDERGEGGKVRPPGPDAARIAVPQGAGSAGSSHSDMSGPGKENFLTPDNQKVNKSIVGDGIEDALSLNRMRRPQEHRTPLTASLNLNTRLVDGSLNLASSQARMGAMTRIPSAGREGEAREIDLSALDSRSSAGSATVEIRSGQTAGAQSLQAPRQADAAAVLENIHRMVEQASARAQDRLSMTLRFEDGSTVRIRLTREGGEFHTVIHTDQPGMETALRQQWSQFSQDAGDRGFKFLSMAFADLGGSADQYRSSNGEDARGEFSDLVTGMPTARPVASPAASDSGRPDRSSTSSTSASSRLRAWV